MTLLALLLTTVPQAEAAEIVVDPFGEGDHTTIMEAVGAASAGDLITINSGTYNEAVSVIGKSINLAGAGSESTTIWVESDEIGLTIESALVGVSGLAVMNGQQGIVVRAATANFSDMLIADNRGADQGGGLSLTTGSESVLSNSVVGGNQATRGGGVFVDGDSKLVVREVTALNNSADEDGGAIYSAGSLLIETSEIMQNSAGGSGGGVYATGDTPDLVQVETHENSAGENGGGIAIVDTTTGAVDPRLKNSDLWANTADGNGGGLYLSGVGPAFFIKMDVVYMNSAGGSGGGAYLNDVSGLTMTYGRYWYNNADGHGGGVYAEAIGGGLSRRSSFGGNTAGEAGGGAYYADPSTAHSIRNNQFIENTATSGGGLLVSGDPNKLHTVQNVDAVGNAGGGIAIVASDKGKVVNANLVDNDGTGLSADADSAGGIFKNNNAVGNETDFSDGLLDLANAANNISEDPLYTRWNKDGEAIGDFLTLTEESPCIDAGKSDVFDSDGSVSNIGSYGGGDAEGGDDDGDGWGPAGGDCDDGDNSVNPDAEEVWHNGRDNDCAGGDDFDQDGDGFRHLVDDCDDTDADVNPDAVEIEGDDIDNDCDGFDGDEPIDGDDTGDIEDPPGADTGAPWEDETDTGDADPFTDADRDGYAQGEDCNDGEASVYPGAPELCDDGFDNDCDGNTDDNDADCMEGDDKGCGCAASPGSQSSWLWGLALVLGLSARRRQAS